MKSINFLSILFFSIVSIQNSLNSLPYKLVYLTNHEQKVCLVYDVHDECKNYLGIDYQNGQYIAAHSNLTGTTSYNYECDQDQLKDVLLKKRGYLLDKKRIVLESEKALLEKIKEVSQASKEKLNLVWEMRQDDRAHEGDIFMSWAPEYILNSFKNVNVISADNFRHIKFPHFCSDLSLYSDSMVRAFNFRWISSYKTEKDVLLALYKDFVIIFEKVIFEILPDKINKLDSQAQKILTNPFIEFYNKYIKPYKNLNDNDLSKVIEELEKDKNYIKDIENTILSGIADIEMIIAILNSKNCILYAGGAHCENIKEILTQKLGFKLEFQSGEEIDFSFNIKRYLIMAKLLPKYLYSKMMYKFTKKLYYLTEQHFDLIKNVHPVEPKAFNILDNLIA